MEAWLRRGMEDNLIALVGYAPDGHEILKFVGDMTAQEWRRSAQHMPTPKSQLTSINVAQWIEARADDPTATLREVL
jgi:hypothetical protein